MVAREGFLHHLLSTAGKLQRSSMFKPDTPLAELEWIPHSRLTPLARLGLLTLGDLIGHYPRRYEDRRRFDRFPADGTAQRSGRSRHARASYLFLPDDFEAELVRDDSDFSDLEEVFDSDFGASDFGASIGFASAFLASDFFAAFFLAGFFLVSSFFTSSFAAWAAAAG